MILFRNKNIKVLQSDYIRLFIEEDDDNVIYVSRQIYNQAVVLADRFEGDCTMLAEKLQIGDNQSLAVEYFIEIAPEPLSMLAPFLAFVSDKLELPCDLEVLCGALHQISTVINFEHIVKVPKEIRANVDFTKRFIQGYVESWEALEQHLLLTDIDIDAIKLEELEAVLNRVLSVMPVAANTTGVIDSNGIKEAYTGEEDSEESDEIPDFFADLLAEVQSEETEESKKPEVKESVQVKVDESEYVEETEEDKINSLIKKFGGA